MTQQPGRFDGLDQALRQAQAQLGGQPMGAPQGTQMAAGGGLSPGAAVTVYIRGMNRPMGDEGIVVGPGSQPGMVKVSVGTSGTIHEVDASTLRPR